MTRSFWCRDRRSAHRVAVATAFCLTLAPSAGWAQEAPAIDPGVFDRLDADKNGVVAASEVSEDAKRVFERLLRTADENGDDKLTRAEFEAGLKDAGPKSETGGFAGGRRPGGFGADMNPERLFNFLDADRDGKLALDEIPGEQREKLRPVFNLLDDGDGKLSLAEFTKAVSMGRDLAAGGRPAEPKSGDDRAAAPEMAGAEEDGPTSPVLAALDANGDGELSADEIAASAERLKKLDKNRDGKLARDELAAPARESEEGSVGRRRRPGGLGGLPGNGFGGAMVGQMLQRSDANGDGKLSRDEAPERMRERFDMLDKNGDAFVDEAELKVVAERLREGFGGARPRGAKKPEGENKPEGAKE